MRLHIDVFMEYRLGGDDRVLLTLEAAQTEGQTVLGTALDIENASVRRIAGNGRIGQRAWAFVADEQFRLRYRAGVQVTENLQLNAALENITNEDYRIHGSGVNQPGISAIIGGKLSW